MESTISLLGALSLIFTTLVVSAAALQLFTQVLYGYIYETQKTGEPFSYRVLAKRCELRKLWVAFVWTRPAGTATAMLVFAGTYRTGLGLSLACGFATLAFVIVGVATPALMEALSRTAIGVLLKKALSKGQ